MDRKTTQMKMLNPPVQKGCTIRCEKREQPKPKHNKWIDGFEAGENFFKLVWNVGYALAFLICIISSAIFLINLGITEPSYLGIAVLLLQVLRLGVLMIILGLVLMYLCKLWGKHLYKKELKVIEEVAYGRGKKEGTV
jgi:hypothetical protein